MYIKGYQTPAYLYQKDLYEWYIFFFDGSTTQRGLLHPPSLWIYSIETYYYQQRSVSTVVFIFKKAGVRVHTGIRTWTCIGAEMNLGIVVTYTGTPHIKAYVDKGKMKNCISMRFKKRKCACKTSTDFIYHQSFFSCNFLEDSLAAFFFFFLPELFYFQIKRKKIIWKEKERFWF